MKNKGRKHIAGSSGNGKSGVYSLTRPVKSMSSKGTATNKFEKKYWIKRMRGYFKGENINDFEK